MGIKRLALITARGGSKRIPKKNIREFCGRPIIGYSIQAAKDAGVFDTVMVSTDSEEIAEIAKKEGAEIPFLRSEETSGDFATTADVIMEVLSEYEKKGVFFDEVCCIYPTAPFVTGAKLKEAVAVLESKAYDSVMPVTPFSFPPLLSFVRQKTKSPCQFFQLTSNSAIVDSVARFNHAFVGAKGNIFNNFQSR